MKKLKIANKKPIELIIRCIFHPQSHQFQLDLLVLITQSPSEKGTALATEIMLIRNF